MTRAGEEAKGEQPDLRSLARGGSLNVLGAGVAAIAQFLSVAVVTRGFTREEAGVFFAATTVFLVGLVLARLGTDIGLVYYIARTRVLDAGGRAITYIRAAVPPVVAASVLGGVVLFAFAPSIAGWAVDGDPGDFAGYLRTLAVFLPVAVVSDTALAATRGFRVMGPTVLVENIGRQTLQLLALAIVSTVGTAALLGLAWVGPYTVAAVVAVLWLRSVLRRTGKAAGSSDSTDDPGADGHRGTDGHPGTTREFWRYTAPRALAALAQLVLLRFDILLVAALLGPAEAAVYTAATRFVLVGQIGNQALGQAVAPQLSEVMAREDRRGARDLYQTATSWLVLLTWPIYLLFAAGAPYLLDLFGSGYDDGSDVILTLSLTMLFATACGQVDTVLIMAGKTTWNLANVLLAMTVNVIADLILIPRMGIMGAAVGWAIALVVKNVVPLAQLALSLRLHPFGRGTLVAAALAMVCFGTLPLVMRLALGDGMPALVAAALPGAVLYAAGCVWQREALRLRELRVVRRKGNGRPPVSRS